MAQLFNKRLLLGSIEKFCFPTGDRRKKIDGIIQAWQTAFKDHDLSKAKETSLQGKFFSKFFCEILGYIMQDDGFSEWTLKQEAKTEVDGKEADGSLGFYSKNNSQTRVVIELKDAQCNLDTKQNSRENKQTPVEQAFQYLYKFADCDWVIVSNFRYTRLYHKSKGQTAYEEFDILTLDDEKEFKKFYYCLCKENLIDKNANSPMDLLIKQSGEKDIDISKEFYSEFKYVRKILFEHITENNLDFDKKLLLEKTQKLLDRFIFIFFCEDTANLLPHNTVENIYNNAKNSFSLSECKIWEQFRGLFAAIDKGNNNVNPPINAYNGGLFAYDEILDKLIIKDEMFEHVKQLARYDFESDLNVNILGHIFEQSLSDLEQLKNEIDGVIEDKKNSKRKKDGIFYTPEYITHYIVEETIGKYLEENPDKISTIKILDPACGSGAFLNQAHQYLRKQWQVRLDKNIKNSEKSQLDLFKHTNMVENDRSILLNNIFGVDLNQESVEITKLALWLKTASQNYKLQNLDENIKCGNSLIDDENIVGNKAFKWEQGFPEIFTNMLAKGERLENGGIHSVNNRFGNNGFDVIIGNPPYVFTRTQGYEELLKKYYQNYLLKNNVIQEQKNKKTQSGKINLYTWFILKSIELLRENGIMGFIVPNGILRTTTYDLIRKYLLEHTKILKIVDLGAGVFENVTTSTVIIILEKTTKLDIASNLNNTIEIISNVEDFISNKYQKHTLQQRNFYENTSYAFNILIDNNKSKINSLLKENTIELGNISKYIIEGIVGSIERDVSDIKEDERYKPFVVGKDIGRYLLEYKNVYIRYDRDLLHRARPEEVFINDKILIQRISGGGMPIKAYLDKKQYYAYASLNILQLKDNTAYSLEYILALLNSKLLNWFYTNNFSNKSNLTVNISKTFLEKLPIKRASQEEQQILSHKAKLLLELNESLLEETKKAIELINIEYKPKKISQSLEKFYLLGLNPFVEELQKQGVNLSLSQKEALIAWYKTKSDLLNGIKSKIQVLDDEIDSEIYKLYGLDDDDIKLIEG